MHLSQLFRINMLSIHELCNPLSYPKAFLRRSHVLAEHDFCTLRSQVGGKRSDIKDMLDTFLLLAHVLRFWISPLFYFFLLHFPEEIYNKLLELDNQSISLFRQPREGDKLWTD